METKNHELYRVGFIGDVHGHIDQFESLLKQMEEHGVDRIVSLGDLFDRGPDGLGCLEKVMNRGFKKRDGSIGQIEMVMGNHDDINIRVYRNLPIPGRKKAPRPWNDKEYKRIKEKHIVFLEAQSFMLRIKEHGLDLVAVHGGFTKEMMSPGWYNFDMGGRLARVGYLAEKDGSALNPGGWSKRLWADEYDGRFGRAMYGHTSFDKPRYSDHALGLDGTKRGKVFGAVISNQEDDLLFEEKVPGWAPVVYNPTVKGKNYGDIVPVYGFEDDGYKHYVDTTDYSDYLGYNTGYSSRRERVERQHRLFDNEDFGEIEWGDGDYELEYSTDGDEFDDGFQIVDGVYDRDDDLYEDYGEFCIEGGVEEDDGIRQLREQTSPEFVELFLRLQAERKRKK